MLLYINQSNYQNQFEVSNGLSLFIFYYKIINDLFQLIEWQSRAYVNVYKNIYRILKKYKFTIWQ